MTNYHVMDENYVKENNQINILLNDEKEAKTINLNIKRKNYFNKNFVYK